MPFNPRTDMFMCDNFVASEVNKHNNNGRIPMVAVPADPTFYFCVTKSGKPMDIYEIREAQMAPGGQAPNGVFMGYWCPYDIDRTSYVTLSGAADYMFTATMDGCSFGIGAAAKDGTVTVSHSNSAKDDTPTSHKPMIAAQKTNLRSLLGTKSKLFQPGNYRSRGFLNKKADVSAMTFGVRSGKSWRFYSHRFRKTYAGMAVQYIYYETVKLS
jgi:hypothetical protein